MRRHPSSPIGYSHAMKLRFDPIAAANFATYRERDPLLVERLREVLRAIEEQSPRARETALRVLGGVAWSIAVEVPGRDESYQVIWAKIGTTNTANVVHIGPMLT